MTAGPVGSAVRVRVTRVSIGRPLVGVGSEPTATRATRRWTGGGRFPENRRTPTGSETESFRQCQICTTADGICAGQPGSSARVNVIAKSWAQRSPSDELSHAPVSVRPSGPTVAANRWKKPGASRHCRQTPSTRLDP